MNGLIIDEDKYANNDDDIDRQTTGKNMKRMLKKQKTNDKNRKKADGLFEKAVKAVKIPDVWVMKNKVVWQKKNAVTLDNSKCTLVFIFRPAMIDALGHMKRCLKRQQFQ